MGTGLPNGTVTFMFTDIEGSTRRWEERPEAMPGHLARHDAILREAVVGHDGHVVKSTGDGIFAAFGAASSAVDAAIAAQVRFSQEDWGPAGPLRIRIGLHTGEAHMRDGDYFGGTLNRAARLMAIAHGGQIVVSLATAELLQESDHALLDLGEHHLRDLGRTEHVFQVIDPRLERDFGPLRSQDARRSNLPPQFTVFVGRRNEIQDVVAALGRSRVVTVTGVGGVGKTRLALEVGAQLLPRFRDGVWLCELATLGDPGSVPSTIASVLRVEPRRGLPVDLAVAEACRRRQMLLILDNCEHLIDAAASMAELLERTCPDVRVLATSREGLGVSGERILALRSLALPDPGSSVDEATASECVQLFLDRTAAARPGFALTEENVTATVQVCRRLDGIPLAIELAAARARMMSPSEISARLDERFRLLTGGSRTTVERHQTLRQAVDWSYDLLDPHEQSLFRQLGVFAGGFTLEAAEAVGSEPGEGGLDAIDGLGQLVDKSLVISDETPAGTRSRLLETRRQSALARLHHHDETAGARRRHASWVADFVADAALHTHGPDEHRWTRRLLVELENIRVALTWAAGTAELDIAARILSPHYWFKLLNSELGYALAPWADPVLALPGADVHPRRSALLSLRALDHHHHSRPDAAVEDAELAVAALDTDPTPFSASPWAALFMGTLLSSRPSSVDPALCEVCVTRALETGDDYELAGSLIPATAYSLAAGRDAQARRFAEDGLLAAKRTGSPTLVAVACNLLSIVVLDDDPVRARQLLRSGLAADEGGLSGNMRGTALVRLARLEGSVGDPTWAASFRPYLERLEAAGDRRGAEILLELYTRALV